MSDQTKPVTGPHRIYVRRIPAGVEMDVSHFFETLLIELAHRSMEDPHGVAEDLGTIAALDISARHQGGDSHARHELDGRVERLLDELGGGELVVYGDQVGRLAWQLMAAAPVAVREQGGDAR